MCYQMMTYPIEKHPADSRVNIDESGKVQTLTSWMGTGGGNVPMVLQPAYCLQGNGIDRADTAGCNGKGWAEEVCYTLNTIDRPAVCYAMQGFGDYIQSEVGSTLTANEAKMPHDLVAAVDCRNFAESPINGTLQAKSNGGFALNNNQVVRVQYIVRRLPPAECARLQGFPDNWGHPDRKDDFTDDEYHFWLTVRNTHATINGKATKEYSKGQMLKWYNGLHTDSSEYKMWGNGIALPTALYVMQGIADALHDAEGDKGETTGKHCSDCKWNRALETKSGDIIIMCINDVDGGGKEDVGFVARERVGPCVGFEPVRSGKKED